MSLRAQVCVLFFALFGAISISPTRADIYRWDNGQVIPGTEGIELGPGVDLSFRGLKYADMSGKDLSLAQFTSSNLIRANFGLANLTEANLSGASLNGASFWLANLMSANLQDAEITGAGFDFVTHNGFVKEQLYSTKSYKEGNLRGIRLGWNNLTDWDFSGQDIRSSAFISTTGLRAEQLYSTTSYQTKSLQGLWLAGNNLNGWDFHEQDLTGSHFELVFRAEATELSNANFSMANLTHSNFWAATLVDANLESSNLSGSFLGGCDLAGANLKGANLTNVDLGAARLAGADFSEAIITGADFGETTFGGFTREQLYSTTNYQIKNLRATSFYRNDLTAWDFRRQDLSTVDLSYATLTDADLTGANLKNANLSHSKGLSQAKFDPATLYNQWTVFPAGFDPQVAGLTFVQSATGDLDANGIYDVADIDMLTVHTYVRNWLPTAMFDLNSDNAVDQYDHRAWIKELKQTWYGDANLDGEFNASDMTAALNAGKYEKRVPDLWIWEEARGEPASWSEGDWNGDGVFDTGDLVKALEDGGYEMGPREPAAVPEPSGVLLLTFGALMAVFRRRGTPSLMSKF